MELMPHIILESSANLPENAQISRALSKLVHRLAIYETVSPRNVKTYHQQHGVYATGEGQPAAFVHCEVEVSPGRPDKVRNEIAQGMYETLVEAFEESFSAGRVAVTLEVREAESGLYMRH